ncbi:superoxide dismutase, Ni [Candidatus Micrarchaeota archaeon]|nr:superoxide dismutase, Ni [Candidatus Micrarchaeota archaeon]
MKIHTLFKLIDQIFPAKVAYAHCDIPCGIYDPQAAQIAAHTVIRMVLLINDLPKPTANSTPEERQNFVHKLARYTDTKEKHSELCKHEVRIIWGDYFKPEHAQANPEIHELVWKIMKLGSKARQEINLQAAEELLQSVNKFAEVFWKTKGVETVRIKSFYPTEREMVVPKPR